MQIINSEALGFFCPIHDQLKNSFTEDVRIHSVFRIKSHNVNDIHMFITCTIIKTVKFEITIVMQHCN